MTEPATKHGVTATELRRFLVSAAGLVQRYGWWNTGLGDRSTGFCIVGAIDEVYNTRDVAYGVRNTAVKWVESLLASDQALHHWNDTLGNKTKSIDYLMRGAETAELGVERLRDYDWQ